MASGEVTVFVDGSHTMIGGESFAQLIDAKWSRYCSPDASQTEMWSGCVDWAKVELSFRKTCEDVSRHVRFCDLFSYHWRQIRSAEEFGKLKEIGAWIAHWFPELDNTIIAFEATRKDNDRGNEFENQRGIPPSLNVTCPLPLMNINILTRGLETPSRERRCPQRWKNVQVSRKGE